MQRKAKKSSIELKDVTVTVTMEKKDGKWDVSSDGIIHATKICTMVKNTAPTYTFTDLPTSLVLLWKIANSLWSL